MAAQILYTNSFNSSLICSNADKILRFPQSFRTQRVYNLVKQSVGRKLSVQCSENQIQTLRTCKNCKTQFDPSLNDPRACRYHTAHFGGNPIYTLLLFFLSFFFFCWFKLEKLCNLLSLRMVYQYHIIAFSCILFENYGYGISSMVDFIVSI